jgi:hypothetical protein
MTSCLAPALACLRRLRSWHEQRHHRGCLPGRYSGTTALFFSSIGKMGSALGLTGAGAGVAALAQVQLGPQVPPHLPAQPPLQPEAAPQLQLPLVAASAAALGQVQLGPQVPPHLAPHAPWHAEPALQLQDAAASSGAALGQVQLGPQVPPHLAPHAPWHAEPALQLQDAAASSVAALGQVQLGPQVPPHLAPHAPWHAEPALQLQDAAASWPAAGGQLQAPAGQVQAPPQQLGLPHAGTTGSAAAAGKARGASALEQHHQASAAPTAARYSPRPLRQQHAAGPAGGGLSQCTAQQRSSPGATAPQVDQEAAQHIEPVSPGCQSAATIPPHPQLLMQQRMSPTCRAAVAGLPGAGAQLPSRLAAAAHHLV